MSSVEDSYDSCGASISEALSAAPQSRAQSPKSNETSVQHSDGQSNSFLIHEILWSPDSVSQHNLGSREH